MWLFFGLGGARTGRLGSPPPQDCWMFPPAGVLVHLLWHPQDHLLEWLQLWECQCLLGCTPVTDQLNLSILSSSRWVATSAHPWASLALVRTQSQESSSLWCVLQGALAGWLGVEALVGQHSCPPPHLCCRCSSKEVTISWTSSSAHSRPHDGGLATSLVGKHHWRSPKSPFMWF